MKYIVWSLEYEYLTIHFTRVHSYFMTFSLNLIFHAIEGTVGEIHCFHPGIRKIKNSGNAQQKVKGLKHETKERVKRFQKLLRSFLNEN